MLIGFSILYKSLIYNVIHFCFSLLWTYVKLLHSYIDVCILHAVSFWSTHAKISLVEEISNKNANGMLKSYSCNACSKPVLILSQIEALYSIKLLAESTHCVLLKHFTEKN